MDYTLFDDEDQLRRWLAFRAEIDGKVERRPDGKPRMTKETIESKMDDVKFIFNTIKSLGCKRFFLRTLWNHANNLYNKNIRHFDRRGCMKYVQIMNLLRKMGLLREVYHTHRRGIKYETTFELDEIDSIIEHFMDMVRVCEEEGFI